jgi:hypothetical protein
VVYKDLPIEQARLRFNELKGQSIPPPAPVKRKLRIPAG